VSALVVDANILVRAVLGRRVRTILAAYGDRVDFFAPEVAFREARAHLPKVLAKRGIPTAPVDTVLDALGKVVRVVERETYSAFEPVARRRLRQRAPEDWPVLATALALRCPIWTEDADFFGAGVATWTTDRVELFLKGDTKA
jgi:predicted nucleic acid-binding protein